MLLLAQQQMLASEEAREGTWRNTFAPRFGADVNRERQKHRYPGAGSMSATSTAQRASPVNGNASAPVRPTAPGLISGTSLGIGGLDEELEEIRRRVRHVETRWRG